MFTVAIFNDGRNDYLEQTLSTFSEQVVFPEKPFKILFDDMPDGRDVAFLKRLAVRFGIDEVVLNDVNVGLFANVMQAWASLPPGTQHVFHLENDFVFHVPVDVAAMARVLDNPTICNVTLLRQAWYQDERRAGGLFANSPGAFSEREVNGIAVCLHREYFGFNPGLYRSDVVRVLPEPSWPSGCIPWLEQIVRDQLLAEDASRQFAVLGRLSDPPRVLHIGYRRVGTSPNHEAPERAPSTEESLAAETRRLELEERILRTRERALVREVEWLRDAVSGCRGASTT
jgi:hypothetical protein